MKDRKLESYRPLVKKVAEHIADSWPEFIEADDLEQELWLCLLQEPSLVKYLDQAHCQAQFKALSRKATSICFKQRVDYDRFSGNWWYNTKDVKGLLIRYSLGEDIPSDERVDLLTGIERMETSAPKWFATIYAVYIERSATAKDFPNHKRALAHLCKLMNTSRNDEIPRYEEEHND